MLRLALPDGPVSLACIGAHCDDVVIGAGATLLRILAEHPGSRVDWLVLSSDETRRQEEIEAAEAFTADASSLEIRVESLPENVLPSYRTDVQHLVGTMAAGGGHDVVLAPRLDDRHQDHRLLAEVAHQKWRDQPIWEYEIAKWDGDLTTPNLYVCLDTEAARRKVELLDKHYPSQQDKHWYDTEAFTSLLRLRGIESNARYAEGFHVRKTAL